MPAVRAVPSIKKSGIRDVTFGEGVTLVEPVNLYECAVGDRCFIGPFVEIQKGVTIGRNTRIQSHTFVCEMVTIGEDCFIGHGVMFINDTFSDGGPAFAPAGGEVPKQWKPTRIGRSVSIGSNATILPVTIADGTIIGAGAVVTRDIDEPGVYAGNPAKLLRKLGAKVD